MDNVAEFLAKLNTKMDSQLAQANQYFEWEAMPLANNMDDVVNNIGDMFYTGGGTKIYWTDYTFSSTNASTPLYTVPSIRWSDHRDEEYFPGYIIVSNKSLTSGSVSSNKAIHTMILEPRTYNDSYGLFIHDFDGIEVGKYAALIFTYGATSPILHKDVTIQYSTSPEDVDEFNTHPYSLTLNNIDVGFVPGSIYTFMSYLN